VETKGGLAVDLIEAEILAAATRDLVADMMSQAVAVPIDLDKNARRGNEGRENN
jgi:hypothetical protein